MKRCVLFCLLIIAVSLVVGCSDNNIKNEEQKFNVVTSFYPMYIATANIMNGAEDTSLICLASPDVGCLHDYQLTVKDMITLETADTFVVNGGGMESFLDKAVSTYPNLNVINASEGILEEHEEHHEEGAEHNHDNNAHIWVSVSLYIKQVENICDKLKLANPQNAELYEENKIEYVKELETLKQEMESSLKDIENKNVVTFHEAFDFFAEEFGLNVVAVIEREPGTSPSAREVAKIIDKINAEDVDAIFVEPQYSKTAANTISVETNIPIFELDPIVSGKMEKEEYVRIMKKNLIVLLEALK